MAYHAKLGLHLGACWVLARSGGCAGGLPGTHVCPPAGVPLKLFLALAEGPMAGPLRRQLMRQNKLSQVGGVGVAAARWPGKQRGFAWGWGGLPAATAAPATPAASAAVWHACSTRNLTATGKLHMCQRMGLRSGGTSGDGQKRPSACSPQILEEVFIPEGPTYQPNLEGWAPEPPSGLAVLGGGQVWLLLPGASTYACSTPAAWLSQWHGVMRTPVDGAESKHVSECLAAGQSPGSSSTGR